MQVDSQTVIEFFMFVHTLWSAPLTLILVFTTLWFYMSWGSFVGIGVFVLIIPTNYVISTFMANSQNKLLVGKDSTIKMINEILSGIKVEFTNLFDSIKY